MLRCVDHGLALFVPTAGVQARSVAAVHGTRAHRIAHPIGPQRSAEPTRTHLRSLPSGPPRSRFMTARAPPCGAPAPMPGVRLPRPTRLLAPRFARCCGRHRRVAPRTIGAIRPTSHSQAQTTLATCQGSPSLSCRFRCLYREPRALSRATLFHRACRPVVTNETAQDPWCRAAFHRSRRRRHALDEATWRDPRSHESPPGAEPMSTLSTELCIQCWYNLRRRLPPPRQTVWLGDRASFTELQQQPLFRQGGVCRHDLTKVCRAASCTDRPSAPTGKGRAKHRSSRTLHRAVPSAILLPNPRPANRPMEGPTRRHEDCRIEASPEPSFRESPPGRSTPRYAPRFLRRSRASAQATERTSSGGAG